MSPRSTRVLLALAFPSLLLGAYAGTHSEASPEIVAHHVAGNVSYLAGRGGNIGVLAGEEGVLLVDDKFLDLAVEIEEAVRGISEGELAFLLNTHWHGDHTGGNPHFGKEAVIVAHTNVRRRLEGDESLGGNVSGDSLPAEALPVVTYDQGLSIHFAGEEVRLTHVPAAHTDGDSVVWFTGSNVVHLGDLYFQSGYPFIDLQSGGGVEGLLAGLRGVLDRLPADARVIPGHGEPTGPEGLREYLTMLETVAERVREHLAEGLGVEDMVTNGITAEFDDRWGGGFIDPRRFVETLAADLDG